MFQKQFGIVPSRSGAFPKWGDACKFFLKRFRDVLLRETRPRNIPETIWRRFILVRNVPRKTRRRFEVVSETFPKRFSFVRNVSEMFRKRFGGATGPLLNIRRSSGGPPENPTL